ncbi:MAG: hypothetical protein WAW59_07285 [Patescibacteria group bacterium]
MFKGTVHLYKNVDGKEEEVKKDFDDEKDFNSFVEKNPELKKLQDFDWEPIKWPALSGFKDFFDDTKRFGDKSFMKELEKDFERMEKEMKSLFDRSKKLLTK